MEQTYVKSAHCIPKAIEIAQAYEAKRQPYWVNTRSYHSVKSLLLTVIASSVDAVNGTAVAVARSGQQLAFFDYGIGQNIQLSGNPTFRATEAETNLTEGSRTNNDDFAFDAIMIQNRGYKVAYAADPFASLDADADIAAAMAGQVPVCDPFAIRTPPQQGSPALLEAAIFQEALKYIVLQLEWDNASRTEKVGPLDQYPVGGGSSYLHANGVPGVQGRVKIPEGYAWLRTGEPGSQMIARAVLTQPLVVPINLPTDVQGAFVPPSALYIEIMLRLGGVHFTTPSTN